MPLRLVPLEEEGKVILLTPPMMLIGRRPTSEGELPSLTVSRDHCVIVPGEGCAYVRDLSSQNGVFINGNRCGPQNETLLVGDEIKFAAYRYRLEMFEATSDPTQRELPIVDEDDIRRRIENIIPQEFRNKVSVKLIARQDAAQSESAE
jgi:pSer/pThr/pTyr-binding forkhead associated (FHA) protein